MIDLDMKLSPHFTLRELVFTSHRGIDNTPTPEVIARLRTLCETFLEPVRAQFGPLHINSGYRSPELNQAIGGVPTSAHCYGCAADFLPVNRSVTTHDIVKWVKEESGLDYDQVIDEWGSSTSNWVHLGQAKPDRVTPRKQALLYKGGRYTDFQS